MTDDKTELAIAKVVSDIRGVSDRVINNLDDEFGSSIEVAMATENNLQHVDGVGPVVARKIRRRTDAARNNPELHLEEDIYSDELRNVRFY